MRPPMMLPVSSQPVTVASFPVEAGHRVRRSWGFIMAGALMPSGHPGGRQACHHIVGRIGGRPIEAGQRLAHGRMIVAIDRLAARDLRSGVSHE